MKRRNFLTTLFTVEPGNHSLCWAAPAAEPGRRPLGSSGSIRALDAVIAPGTKVERVATGFVFTEGPMWRQEAVVLRPAEATRCAPSRRTARWSVLIEQFGRLSQPARRQYRLERHGHRPGWLGLMTQMGARRIVRARRPARHAAVPDAIIRARGSTAPTTWSSRATARYGSPIRHSACSTAWTRIPPSSCTFNAVFRYANGKLTPVITDLTLPNGIGFSPDGKTLYVTNYGPGHVCSSVRASARTAPVQRRA